MIFVFLGGISYSVYLWHTTVFGGLDILLASFNKNIFLWSAKTFLRFFGAIGIGYISYRFIEKPILRKLAMRAKFSAISGSAT
jgi:peptidoglycan/LPS O-acetylase OafA/YrhL